MNTQGADNFRHRGLATLAVLKSRFDRGEDHLGLLEPFAIDVLSAQSSDAVATTTVKDGLYHEHGLAVPLDVVSAVLARLVKKGMLRREGGLYWRTSHMVRDSKLDAERHEFARELAALGTEFVSFLGAGEHGVRTPDDALAVLSAFLVDNDVVVLLEEFNDNTSYGSVSLSDRMVRRTARFVRDRVFGDPALKETLQRLLRGLVLQNALLLRNAGTREKKLQDVSVLLDTGFLFGLVGAKGVAAQLAAKESCALLREVGANLIVVDRTIAEMQRILIVYENCIGTSDGRLRLRPTELTFHFLASGSTPSSIRQLSALLPTLIGDCGIVVRAMPRRDPTYTASEQKLADLLAGRGDHPGDRRIQHDVDCIAAVLQLRRGAAPASLETCRAVFATTSGIVVKSVNSWFREEGVGGISPIIHQLALVNLGWLKRPSVAPDVQIHELAAVCEALLRPSPQMWEKIKRTVVEMRESGQLTSDEAIGIVSDELTFGALSALDEEPEVDASDLHEVVERVKASYRAKAQQEVEKARTQNKRELRAALNEAATARVGRNVLAVNVTTQAMSAGRIVGNVVAVVLLLSFLAGAVLAIPGVLDGLPRAARFAAGAIAIVTGLVQVAFLVVGGSLLSLRNAVAGRVSSAVLKRVSGGALVDSNPAEG